VSLAIYPFLMVPEFYERVWGTRDLRPYFSRPVEGEPVGEVWLTGEECRVANGPLAGQTLLDLALRYGAALTGEAAPEASRFPLLIKFLYPRQKLSVQVHPDDEGAGRVGASCGKTECWYVARAVEGAQVGLGLRPGITREMFRMAIEANQAEHMLNWLDVRAGEMIYVDAGTVHAVGANSILVETQQTSDITYRLYDYGRPRELHIDRGLAATRLHTAAGQIAPKIEGARTRLIEQKHAGWVTPQATLEATPASSRASAGEVLLSSPCFAVERYQVESPLLLSAAPGKTSVSVLVCLDGGAVVECAGSQPLPLMRGEAVVIPAALPAVTLRPQWKAEILRMRLPSTQVAEPRTTWKAAHTGSTHTHR
jgi:mannose-6-phosphate isomerase